jgi:FkbM family methyltransferase
MSVVRRFAKSSAVFFLGRQAKPRRIFLGLARGCRISVSPADSLSYVLGTAEPELQRAIRQYVSTGQTVYDIGANIGYVSLSLARQVGPTGHVFAFEPVPQNLASLRENVANNSFTNIHVIDAAASDVTGAAEIRIAGNFSTASLLWHRGDPSVQEISVKTVVIDELVKAGELPAPSFIKIDVEGAEGLVLRGMQRTISSAKPVLFIECSDLGRETTWQLLRDLHYRCRHAENGKQVETLAEYRHANFLWLPPIQ